MQIGQFIVQASGGLNSGFNLYSYALTNLPGKIYEGECQELETQMEWDTI